MISKMICMCRGSTRSSREHRPLLQTPPAEGCGWCRPGSWRDLPGLLPGHVLLVDEDAHQLGDSQRRVGVVHLHGRPFPGTGSRSSCVAQIAADDIAHRAGHQEVLLHQAQLLARHHRIGGIEDAGDVFAADLLLHGADVVAAVEDLDVEVLRRARRNRRRKIDVVAAVADDRHVAGHADDRLISRPVWLRRPYGIMRHHQRP